MRVYNKYPHAKLTMPKLAGDVGYNIPVAHNQLVNPGEYVEVMSGVHVELPVGYWGEILPRSSANRSGKLVVLSGVIDTGYRGELGVFAFYKVSFAEQLSGLVCRLSRGRWGKRVYPLSINAGTSLGQLVLHKSHVFELEEVGDLSKLSESERGHNGFGSTGQGI